MVGINEAEENRLVRFVFFLPPGVVRVHPERDERAAANHRAAGPRDGGRGLGSSRDGSGRGGGSSRRRTPAAAATVQLAGTDALLRPTAPQLPQGQILSPEICSPAALGALRSMLRARASRVAKMTVVSVPALVVAVVTGVFSSCWIQTR